MDHLLEQLWRERMQPDIQVNLDEMKTVLKSYIEKGCLINFNEIKDEPAVISKPVKSNFSKLSCSFKQFNLNFFAVDCSTRTLKRANNWGIYLLRVTYATVKERVVNWDFRESIKTISGPSFVRRKLLQEIRLQLESKMALDILRQADNNDYVLLDGASYFGGERKFNVLLYDECEKKGIKLLAISKQSPTLRDEKGRDFIAKTYALAPNGCWIYHPVRKFNVHKHLYGDVSIIKLSKDSPRAFRCDIMGYLLEKCRCDVHSLLSPLMTISEDPRCLGYPVVLWLAHDFSGVSDAKLLQYYVQVEETLEKEGLLDVLRHEELACNFADELHGARYPFNQEWIDRV